MFFLFFLSIKTVLFPIVDLLHVNVDSLVSFLVLFRLLKYPHSPDYLNNEKKIIKINSFLRPSCTSLPVHSHCCVKPLMCYSVLFVCCQWLWSYSATSGRQLPTGEHYQINNCLRIGLDLLRKDRPLYASAFVLKGKEINFGNKT